MMHPVAASKAELPPASLTIGIDISKDHLGAARHPDGDTIRVANTRKGQPLGLGTRGPEPMSLLRAITISIFNLDIACIILKLSVIKESNSVFTGKLPCRSREARIGYNRRVRTVIITHGGESLLDSIISNRVGIELAL